MPTLSADRAPAPLPSSPSTNRPQNAARPAVGQAAGGTAETDEATEPGRGSALCQPALVSDTSQHPKASDILSPAKVCGHVEAHICRPPPSWETHPEIRGSGFSSVTWLCLRGSPDPEVSTWVIVIDKMNRLCFQSWNYPNLEGHFSNTEGLRAATYHQLGPGRSKC